MKLTLLIGPSETAAMRFRLLFKQKAEALAKAGIAAPDWNHVRLYAACAESEAVGVLRYRRGLDSPLVQQTLTAEFQRLFATEVPKLEADHVVISAAQFGNLLYHPTELDRLRELLAPFFDRVDVVAHVEEQARALLQHYNFAVLEGRRHPLSRDIARATEQNWRAAALKMRSGGEPHFGLFDDIQHPPFWLDYAGLLSAWESAFGEGHVTLRPLDLQKLYGTEGTDVLATALAVPNTFGAAEAAPLPMPDAAASLTRMRQMNEVMIRFAQARELVIPRDLWSQVHRSIRIPGPAIAPGSLSALSDSFAARNATLTTRFPDLATALTPAAPAAPWVEADPEMGFRATQYLAAYAHALQRSATPLVEKRAEAEAAAKAAEKFEAMTEDAAATPIATGDRDLLLNRVKVNHRMILGSPFRPHNRFGAVNEEDLAAPYAPSEPGSTNALIVACMKNEAPYILEWVAYHRAIGVRNFLIYTNDCTDGTDAILARLAEMGVIEHRSNDDWRGNSPQQHALNRAMKEPLVQQADWIAHIDLDEFINIRTGNGTLSDLLAAVPNATNIAMTWRLFGHNGVQDLRDDLVIDQFDTCAPSYCPKPHTAWGFKTLFRNIGAYGKLSCHRPNKLNEDLRDRVKWVNGSGRDMTRDAIKNGWRSSKSNVGYDLVQLNHYALRSAESFLIKRQRGRALHVDRSIGLNYWIRMDWSDHRDLTIKRNIPRLRAELDRLLADPALKAAHDAGFAWHRAKAAELQREPEFADLYASALGLKLDETERVAYALALDMES